MLCIAKNPVDQILGTMGRMGPGKRVRWADLLDIDDDNDDCDDDLEIDQPVASACLDVSIDI